MLQQALFIFFASSAVIAAEDCSSKFLTSNFYKELGCQPVFEDGSNCPARYDCSGFEGRDKGSCRYKGASYPAGTKVPSDKVDKCVAECKCLQAEGNGLPYFSCANVECPELFMGPLHDPKCTRLYKEDTCCSTSTYCKGEGPEPATCKHGRQIYMEGEKFYPPEEPCKVCYCKQGFDGNLTEPFCKDVSCNVELHSGRDINDNCVPIYYGTQGCCPIDWRCPSSNSDKILPQSQKLEATTSSKCKFGNLELSQHEVLETQESDLECKCSVPPYLTCVKLASGP